MNTNTESLTSLSQTLRQLLIDGAEAHAMENNFMVSIMYPGHTMSYIVAHLNVPYTSVDDLLSMLDSGINIVDSLRFY